MFERFTISLTRPRAQTQAACRARGCRGTAAAVTRAFLSLGSNLGDRLAHLRAALEALDRGPRMKLRRASRTTRLAPVEVEEYQPDYLNCVAEIECGVLARIELLRYCQGVGVGPGARAQRRKAARLTTCCSSAKRS